MRRTKAGRVTPAVLFAVWVLSTFLVVTLSVAQTPPGGWSPETEIAVSLDGTQKMYAVEPPTLSLAADSHGDWHLAYQFGYLDNTSHWLSGVAYANASGVSKVVVPRQAGDPGLMSRPALAVGPDDTPALVYGEQDWPAGWKLYLMTGLTAPEPAVQMIASGLDMYTPASDPSLCFDPQGNWHVVYALHNQMAGGVASGIYHLTADATEEVASALLRYGTGGSTLSSPSISADPDGYLHMAFVREAPHEAATLEIADNASGAWSLPQTLVTLMADNVEVFSPAPPGPSLVMDDVGNWNLAWLDGFRMYGYPADEWRYVMVGAAGSPAVALAESRHMYQPDGTMEDEVGPVALARDLQGAWHVAYARSGAPPEQGQPSWRILYCTKGLPGGYYWCHLAGPTNLAPGQTAAYTLSYGVTVSDPNAYTWPLDVTLTADLPGFLSYLSDTSGLPVTAEAHHATWHATLQPNETRSFTVNASVPPGAAAAVGEFTLAAAGDYFAPGASALSLKVTRPEVDVAVVKSLFGPPRPGFPSTYHLVVWNAGNAAAQSVSVEDWLPAELGFVSCSNGGSYDATGHRVSWNLGDVGPGRAQTVSVQVTTPAGLPLGAVVRNTVWAASSEGLEVNYADNVYTLDSAVVGSWGPNDKAVAPTGVVPAGGRLTYFIQFENQGTVDAANARVADFLDADLDDTTLLGLSPEAHYNASTRQLTWDFPGINLAPGESRVLTFSVCTKAGLEPGTEITNQAHITFDSSPPIATPVVTNTIGGGAKHLRLYLTPRVLNLRSQGIPVTAKVEVEGEYRPSDVNVASLRLVPGNLAPLRVQVSTTEDPGGPKQALAATFDRQALQKALPRTDPVSIAVFGMMNDGTPFAAVDSVRLVGF